MIPIRKVSIRIGFPVITVDGNNTQTRCGARTIHDLVQGQRIYDLQHEIDLTAFSAENTFQLCTRLNHNLFSSN